MSKRIDPKLPIAPTFGDDPAIPLMKPDRYMDRLVRRLNELFREFSGTISLMDEGTYLGEVDALNFVGTPVTATIDSNGIGVITITGTGSSTTAAATPLLTVLDEGVTQGAGADISQMNFVGTPVTATVTSGVATIRVVGSSLTSPLTTKGDVWGYDTADNRIPIGQDNYVLIADSAQTLGLKWGPVPQQYPIYVYFA